MADINGNKTGGRKKGTPNRTSKEIREALGHLFNNNLERFEQELDKLEGMAYVKVMLQLVHYVAPKIKAIEHKVADDEEIFGWM